MPEKHIIDAVGPIEFFREIIKFHGPQRAGQLFGYAVVWGGLGLNSKQEVLKFCQEDCGMNQRTAYRLVDDFAEFLHHLEVKYGWHGDIAAAARECQREVSARLVP